MADLAYQVALWTGVMVWASFACGIFWLAVVAVSHAVKAWEMAGRIVLESKTTRPRFRWWAAMFWNGPVTSITTADDDHTIFWPGCEPDGWYSDTGKSA